MGCSVHGEPRPRAASSSIEGQNGALIGYSPGAWSTHTPSTLYPLCTRRLLGQLGGSARNTRPYYKRAIWPSVWHHRNGGNWWCVACSSTQHTMGPCLSLCHHHAPLYYSHWRPLLSYQSPTNHVLHLNLKIKKKIFILSIGNNLWKPGVTLFFPVWFWRSGD